MEGKDAAFMVRHIIGDSENTRIWLDPWHHRGLLRDWFPLQLTYNSTCNFKAKVSAIMQEGKWSIPESLWRAAPDIAEIIEGTDIWGGDDEIVWAPSVH